ncbi:MAG TPA: GNAT family N-acetyltransferase [Actinoplanes sp.]|nr:GNAT family N-acetyltransferase [Actinoplanes sp.]
MLDDVSIRTADEEDVRAFVRDQDDQHFFSRHLGPGRGVLLLAFRRDRNVGQVFLRLDEAEEPELRTGLPEVPRLQRLKVSVDHRRTGVGRHLVRAAERLLFEDGHRQVALGVHPGNFEAISFYKGLSFTVWREQTLTTFREHVRDDGSTVREEEPCLVFVKRLGPPSS